MVSYSETGLGTRNTSLNVDESQLLRSSESRISNVGPGTWLSDFKSHHITDCEDLNDLVSSSGKWEEQHICP